MAQAKFHQYEIHMWSKPRIISMKSIHEPDMSHMTLRGQHGNLYAYQGGKVYEAKVTTLVNASTAQGVHVQGRPCHTLGDGGSILAGYPAEVKSRI